MPRGRPTVWSLMIAVALCAVSLALGRTCLLAVRNVRVGGRLKNYENIQKSRPLTAAEVEEVARFSAQKRAYEQGR